MDRVEVEEEDGCDFDDIPGKWSSTFGQGLAVGIGRIPWSNSDPVMVAVVRLGVGGAGSWRKTTVR